MSTYEKCTINLVGSPEISRLPATDSPVSFTDIPKNTGAISSLRSPPHIHDDVSKKMTPTALGCRTTAGGGFSVISMRAAGQ